jgi:hypothetical protein
MSDILIKLRQVGYEVSAEGSEVHLRWGRDEPPRRERVLPLLREAKRRKREILAALARLARPSHGDEAPARRLTPRAHEPADGAEWTSPASRPRAPEHSIANATHPDCQGTTLDNPGPSPDEEAAESSASIDAIDTQASGAREAIPPVDLTRCGWCGPRSFGGRIPAQGGSIAESAAAYITHLRRVGARATRPNAAEIDAKASTRGALDQRHLVLTSRTARGHRQL